jgi:hypothetical protein
MGISTIFLERGAFLPKMAGQKNTVETSAMDV